MKNIKSALVTVLAILVLIVISGGLLAANFNTEPQTTPPAQQGNDDDKNNTDKLDESQKAMRRAEIDKILNDPYMVLVNIDYSLDADYEPANLTTIEERRLEKKAAEQLTLMLAAAEQAGFDTINIYSAYRNYTRQETNFNNKIDYYIGEGYSSERAKELAAAIVNPPGKSEHQTGLAVDICSAEIVNRYGNLNEEFENTEAYVWLYEHCAEYGFILRYPKDKVEETGISFEPWHYRYVGTEYAKDIMNKKVCLEEYIEALRTERKSLEAE